ncbi:hypothetical protein HZB90_02345 [archaeon]|nr:hypothetical protein [archaeon]
MGLVKTCNTVPFDLELLVDVNHVPFEEHQRRAKEIEERTRARICELYPAIKPSGSYFDGSYKIFSTTDPTTFRNVFGDVGRGVSVMCFPQMFFIPVDLRIKWYQTGDLTVPEGLKDLVRQVYVDREGGIGSFRELHLSVPAGARRARRY